MEDEAGFRMRCGHQLAFEANNENWIMSREEDDKSERTYWTIDCCLDETNCTPKSWKRKKPWSLESEKTCLNYLAHHLLVSSLHVGWDKKKIFETLNQGNVKITTAKDTFEDREEYRRQIAEAEAQAQQEKEEPQPKKRKDSCEARASSDPLGSSLAPARSDAETTTEVGNDKSNIVVHPVIDMQSLLKLMTQQRTLERGRVSICDREYDWGAGIMRSLNVPVLHTQTVSMSKRELLEWIDIVSKKVRCVRRFEVESLYHVSGKW